MSEISKKKKCCFLLTSEIFMFIIDVFMVLLNTSVDFKIRMWINQNRNKPTKENNVPFSINEPRFITTNSNICYVRHHMLSDYDSLMFMFIRRVKKRHWPYFTAMKQITSHFVTLTKHLMCSYLGAYGGWLRPGYISIERP